ncbi:MAG: IS66 family transposase [Terricaulis sp.]
MESGDDIASLKAALAAMTARAIAAEADAAYVKARLTTTTVLIESLELEIARLRRETYGQTSERGARLIDQLEFQLEDLEADRAEDEIAADDAARKAGRPEIERRRRHPVKKPFPAHLPRERVVVSAPIACACCGSQLLAKLGEDITETLEAIPRRYKVIQTVREKFTCRDCEKISQAPAPFHVIARGHVGASLLAMVLYDKYTLHQPLNRQSGEFARAGIDLPVSTLADHVGAAAMALTPLYALIEEHVFAGERIHGDDTTVPLLAKGKTIIARLWIYVRDDKPFAGPEPPAAIYYFSSDREGVHPQTHLAHYHGVLQADAYGGYTALYAHDRPGGPITEAACWAHGKRKFYVLADLAAKTRDPRVVISPVALEAVARIDAIFEIEREINGASTETRRAVRQARSKPLVDDLQGWMIEQRQRVSGKTPLGKALNYMLKRWDAFARFLDDGRLCLTNNAAERALRGVAIGRKSWLFAGSERGGARAAMIYTLITTAKLNGVDPYAWLADVLARIAEHSAQRLSELLPWNWRPAPDTLTQAA